MSTINGELLQNLFTGAGVIGLALWAAWERLSKARLQNASNEAGMASAMAQESVFNMLNHRLDTMEKEIQTLRGELAVERAHSRKLELHIWKLENLMRASNIDPPVFEDNIHS